MMAIDYSGLSSTDIAADKAATTVQAKKVSASKVAAASKVKGSVAPEMAYKAAVNTATTTQPTTDTTDTTDATDKTKTNKTSIPTLTPEEILAKTKEYTATVLAGMSEQQKSEDRLSAYNILKMEFDQYGLGSLVSGIKDLLESNTPPAEFSLRLRETPQYKERFKANEQRIAAGLTALSPAEYVAMEDQYQNVMRNYDLPSSYYTKDATGKQAGFEKFLASDVSASELEDRIATAQQRVLNTNPEVLKALKQFYPDLGNADILAYTLDPQNALVNIKRKVTAAEIGGAALAQGLQIQGGTAETLAGQGITKAQAQQGYVNVAEMAPRGGQLADIYKQGPYTQGTAEAEVFGGAGAAEATAKRKKLTALEQAQFSGSSGVGSLSRDRALSAYMTGQPGAGSY